MGNGLTEEQQTEPKTYGDIFDEMFPHYLVMGMTSAEYWDGESWLKKSYRKAYRLQREYEERSADRSAWLNGAYIRDALQSIALLVNGFLPQGVRPLDYPQKPRLEEAEERKKKETVQKKQEEQMMLSMAMFQSMVEKFNKNFLKRQQQKQA